MSALCGSSALLRGDGNIQNGLVAVIRQNSMDVCLAVEAVVRCDLANVGFGRGVAGC